MFSYEWQRFGALIKHHGVPMYAGAVLLTPWSLVWWWPVNWIIFIWACGMALKDKLKGKKQQ